MDVFVPLEKMRMKCINVQDDAVIRGDVSLLESDFIELYYEHCYERRELQKEDEVAEGFLTQCASRDETIEMWYTLAD